jgi:hypothetical protein
MGMKPRHTGRTFRPKQDGDPFPLAHGDFVLAYAYAKRWLTLDGRRKRFFKGGRETATKKATDKGLQELAKIRGVETLPRRNSRKLRRQLKDAMGTVWDRWDDPNRGDALGHKPPLKQRWAEHIGFLVHQAFYRTWDYYVPTNGDVHVRVATAQAVVIAGAQRTTFPNGTPRPGATYVIGVTRDWYRDVYKRDLSVIDGRVVLAAKERSPSDPDLFGIADAVYEVTYVIKGHGYDLRLQDGIAARIGDVWTLVPYGTEGALQPKVADLHRAYRLAYQQLRKRAYERYRKGKAS